LEGLRSYSQDRNPIVPGRKQSELDI